MLHGQGGQSWLPKIQDARSKVNAWQPLAYLFLNNHILVVTKAVLLPSYFTHTLMLSGYKIKTE